MSRSPLSLSFLSALVTILAAIIGTELWLPRYSLGSVGLRLNIQIHDDQQDTHDGNPLDLVGDEVALEVDVSR